MAASDCSVATGLSMLSATQVLLRKLGSRNKFRDCLIPFHLRPPGSSWADMTVVLKALMRTTDPDSRGALLGFVSVKAAISFACTRMMMRTLFGLTMSLCATEQQPHRSSPGAWVLSSVRACLCPRQHMRERNPGRPCR